MRFCFGDQASVARTFDKCAIFKLNLSGSEKISMRILTILVCISIYHFAFAADQEDTGMDFSYPKSSKLAINSERLGLCMSYVASKLPKLEFSDKDIICKWFDHVPTAERTDGNKANFYFYLKARDRKCDYTTVHEEELKNWILSQPDNSIDLIKLFEQSLKTHNGNIKAALLCVHNLLRNEARFWDGDGYYYKSSKAEAKNVFNKFIDIRGDLRERGGDFKGDHKGSWYRIWGVMLGRLWLFSSNSLTSSLDKSACRKSKSLIPFSFEKFATDYIAEAGIYATETIAKDILKPFGIVLEEDKYKQILSNEVSKAAGSFVDGLRENSLLLRSGINDEACSASQYLMPHQIKK
jgi:hypothetical protein